MKLLIYLIPIVILVSSCEFQTTPTTKNTLSYDTNAVISCIKDYIINHDKFEFLSSEIKSNKNRIDYTILFKTQFHDTDEFICKANVSYDAKSKNYLLTDINLCDADSNENYSDSFCTKKSKHKNPIESNICKIAMDNFPENPKMQAITYKKQMSAYIYMKSIENTKLKLIAQSEHPKDYSRQKLLYKGRLSHIYFR